MVPIIDPAGLQGGLFDPHEGNLDPHGATHAYAGAARKRGADVIQHNRVLDLTKLPTGEWRLETEQGAITAAHVVNAGGLWARKVGHMVGVDHPLVPMQHHYLVTEDVPEVAAIEGDMPRSPTSRGSPTCSASATACCLAFTRPTRSTGWSMARAGTTGWS